MNDVEARDPHFPPGLPPRRHKPKRVKVSKASGTQEILVVGAKDPRGPDNNIYVWVCAEGKLHIRVLKTDRCYKFEKVVQYSGYVEVVAV